MHQLEQVILDSNSSRKDKLEAFKSLELLGAKFQTRVCNAMIEIYDLDSILSLVSKMRRLKIIMNDTTRYLLTKAVNEKLSHAYENKEFSEVASILNLYSSLGLPRSLLGTFGSHAVPLPLFKMHDRDLFTALQQRDTAKVLSLLNSPFATIPNFLASFKHPFDNKTKLELFQVIRLKSLIPPTELYNQILNIYASSGDSKSASALFQEMNRNSVKPDIFTYNIMIKAYSNAADWFNLLRFFNNLIDSGVKLDKHSFNTIIAAFCRKKDTATALKYFKEMQIAQVEPDLWTFSTLIHSLRKNKDFVGMESLFSEMTGRGIRPNAFIYRALIGVHSSVNDYEKVTHYFQLMEKDGFEPDSFDFNAFLKANLHDTIAILELIEKAVTKFDSIDSAMANSFLNTLISSAAFLPSYEKLKERGFKHTTQTYYLLCKFSIDSGNFTALDKYLTEMHNTLSDNSDRLLVYKGIFAAFAGREDSKNAKKYFKQMVDAGLKPDVVVYTNLMQSCVSDVDLVNDWMDEMKSRGIQADAHALTVMINANAGDVILAENIYKKVIDPTLLTFNSMLNVYAKSGINFKTKMLGILTEMRNARIQPSLSTFNCIIEGLSRGGHAREALGVWKRLSGVDSSASTDLPFPVFKMPIDTCTICVALDACRFGYQSDPTLKDEAIKIWSFAQTCDLELVSNCLTSFVECMIAFNHPSTAVHYIEEGRRGTLYLKRSWCRTRKLFGLQNRCSSRMDT